LNLPPLSPPASQSNQIAGYNTTQARPAPSLLPTGFPVPWTSRTVPKWHTLGNGLGREGARRGDGGGTEGERGDCGAIEGALQYAITVPFWHTTPFSLSLSISNRCLKYPCLFRLLFRWYRGPSARFCPSLARCVGRPAISASRRLTDVTALPRTRSTAKLDMTIPSTDTRPNGWRA
jgi:hypothetical protein